MQSTNWEVPEKITTSHAWRRYVARNFDCFFYGYIASFILGIINYDDFDINLSTTLLGIIIFFISPFINTILIFFFRNTLGKGILGVKILELNNIKPSPIGIFKREFWVYIKGMGLGIPFIDFITIFLSYCHLIDDQITSWDK